MPTPFLFLRRGRIWTIVYEDAAGKKRQRATKFRGADQESKAQAVLKIFIERRARTERVQGAADEGPLTVARLAALWLASRRKKEISTADDYESRLRMHVLPVIGELRADKVTLEDVERVMAEVAAKAKANKTQRRVYQAMQAMFNWAVPKYLEASPCKIKGEDLPPDTFSKPNFQAEAEFSRAEVVLILTSPLIPIDRRIFYAVMFLAGMRFGEISALRVRDYHRDAEPLGKLLVGRSYNSKRKVLKGTKTNVDRVVPVHPELGRLLAWWLDVGWAQLMGRPPGPDDVLIPTRRGTHRDSSTMWRQFNGERDKAGKTVAVGDLERLGLRRRRQHDTRHTFSTLLQEDGGRRDLLPLITHGPGKKMIDQYTSRLPWKVLCTEVAKLDIRLGDGPHKTAETSQLAQREVAKEVAMSEKLNGFQVLTERPQRDSNPQTALGQRRTDGDSHGQVACLHGRASPAGAANDGQRRPAEVDGNLGNLTLRQALAAIDRGRIDQAREILQRAIEAESRGRKAAFDVRLVGAGS